MTWDNKKQQAGQEKRTIDNLSAEPSRLEISWGINHSFREILRHVHPLKLRLWPLYFQHYAPHCTDLPRVSLPGLSVRFPSIWHGCFGGGVLTRLHARTLKTKHRQWIKLSHYRTVQAKEEVTTAWNIQSKDCCEVDKADCQPAGLAHIRGES